MKNCRCLCLIGIFGVGFFHSTGQAEATDIRTIEGVTNPFSLAIENGFLYVANAYLYPWDVPLRGS